MEKTYLAEVDGVPSAADFRRLRDGVDLDDGPAQAVRGKMIQESRDGTSAIEIVMKEGRKRIVRRMCSAVGHPVRRLVRTRIGPLQDLKLPPGAHRALTPSEVRALYVDALSGRAEPPD